MSKADSGILPVESKSIDAYVRKAWGREPTKNEWKLIVKRIQLLEWLNDIYPLELQSQDIKGNYTKLYPFGEAEMHAPVVYYRILPNELVFDIDGDVKESFEVTKQIVNVLKTLGCKPAVGYSGNRGFHIHVIVTAEGVNPKDFAQGLYTKEWRNYLFELILSFLPENVVDYVDTGIIKAKAHTIRAFYSLNLKTMKWKQFVKPCDQYYVWEIGKSLGQRIFKEMTKDEEIKEIIKFAEELEKEEKRSKSKLYFANYKNDDELFKEVVKLLDNVKEYDRYVQASCPFHPPDNDPSLTIYKPSKNYPFYLVIDWHTGERMSLRRFYRELIKIKRNEK